MNKILLSVLMVFVLSSATCNQKKIEKQVQGKWEITEAEFLNVDEIIDEFGADLGLTEDEKQEMKDEIVEGLVEEFKGLVLEFDGNTFITPDTKGKWEYNEKEDCLDIEEGDMEYKMLVDKASKQNLDVIMVIEDAGIEMKLLMKMKKKE